MSLLKRTRNIDLLKTIPGPAAVWEYFLAVSEVPHPSGSTQKLAAMLVDIGTKLGFDVARDACGNVRYRVPESPGKESVPSVCLQAHMDMVPQAAEGYNFNFETTPVDVSYDKSRQVLHADRTTLGADNGIGVALALAIVSDKTLSHGPLECLFTVDEETTMAGAEQLEGSPFLISKHFINVDNEDDGKICIGNAGGFEVEYKLSSNFEVMSPGDATAAVRVVLSGFQSGHTGVDIAKGRNNAIKSLMLLLQLSGVEFKIVEFDSGIACNAIPPKAVCTVVMATKDVSTFKTNMSTNYNHMIAEYLSIEGKYVHATKSFDHHMNLEMAEVTGKKLNVPVAPFTRKLIDLVLALPDGVLRMIPSIPDAVETSIALVKCNITTKNDAVLCSIWMHARSSSAYQLQVLNEKLQAISRGLSVPVNSPLNPYPSWKANPFSHTVEIMQQAAVALTGNKYEEFAVHAGLECGYILSHYPGMDCVSVGPDCRDVHTPMETVSVPSVGRNYEFLKKTLELFN